MFSLPPSFIVCLLLIVTASVIWKYLHSAEIKGKRGEALVNKELQQLPNDYTVLYDVVLPTDKGTTQIDHIVIAKYGVFVIETKNYRGDIYGNDSRKEWTQVIVTPVTYQRKWYKTYTYVTKNKMYNPVKQSLGHMFRVKEWLKAYPHLPVVPIVVFVGEADLSHVESTHAVLALHELRTTITNYKTIYLSDEDTAKVVTILQAANVRESVSNTEHVAHIKIAKRQTAATIKAGICPRCGGTLIKRSGKYGTFYGCSNYPKCRFTINK
ncbi:MAG: NERD domain-containing protein [Bacteroidales bacterium]|nr:NERD domain-containing protein [Candidatus Equimonas enterica]